VTKLYSKKIAAAVAANKTKKTGIKHFVVDAGNGVAYLRTQETYSVDDEGLVADAMADTQQAAAAVEAMVVPAVQESVAPIGTALVTLTLDRAKETPRYFVGFDATGQRREFEKGRVNAQVVGGQLVVVLTRREAKKRKLVS
jgi:hypothetical protein